MYVASVHLCISEMMAFDYLYNASIKSPPMYVLTVINIFPV